MALDLAQDPGREILGEWTPSSRLHRVWYPADSPAVNLLGHRCPLGKSSSIDRRHLAGQGWRVLDADAIKDYLLRDAIEQGIYTNLLSMYLAAQRDGPVRDERRYRRTVGAGSEATLAPRAVVAGCADPGCCS
ncbi:hypothetical protein ACFVKB_48000 [Rhodococcus sp. NPDC127530]|uniref:hypothetical protein n=1 Tax=unclassified Rhodococcus (in: high G+C Gram-positive bacteria) TaxID=192944 RepID=UPI00362DC790